MTAGDDISAEAQWARARLAATLLAINPVGIGGIWIRARSGPVRDRFRTLLDEALPDQAPLHPAVTDAQLFGEIDLSQTLASGSVVHARGLLARGSVLRLAMAERCPTPLAARIAQALDQGEKSLIALDEGADTEEALPGSLSERIGLFVHLDALPVSATDHQPIDLAGIAQAKARLASTQIDAGHMESLVNLAAQLGISSLRAPLFAKAVAVTSAALFGRNSVCSDDVQLAAELVYAHRATQFPAEDSAADTPPSPPQDDTLDNGSDSDGPQDIPQDLLLEAVAAALPQKVLDMLAANRASRSAKGSGGSGSAKKGHRRGRPLPSKPGKLGTGAKIDLVATLRAAAPWQSIRSRNAPERPGLHIRASDVRIKQYEETSDRLLIFVVDASGSAAMARLAEAKGAVELLLGEAYSRRDHVSLIAFRGDGADVLLPPTRSLVQTKRRLAGLPGGGGTPLAAGIQAAITVSNQAKSKGMDPTIAILTDGRANIALDGTVDRTQAAEDANRLAHLVRASGIPALVIDTSNRPQASLQGLSTVLNATYIAMPRANAERLSGAVSAAMQD